MKGYYMKFKKKASTTTAILNGLGKITETIVDSLSSQEVLCGKYADGKPRSFIDAIRGEYISPKKKSKKKKEKEKKKKDADKKLKKLKKEKKKLKKLRHKLIM